MHQHPQQPHQPPHNHRNNHHQLSPISNPNSTLPDFLFTAISLILFITAPKHHHQHHHLLPRSPHLTATTNRRLIRLTMSQNPNPNSRNFPYPFPTPQSLSDWLKPRLPSDSFASWGTKPGTKNVHNLWLELSDGETSLVDTTPPVRNLEVVCVRIMKGDDNQMLVESHQELSDGSIRKRDRPLSEKLKFGEDIESGVKRAVKEELGSLFFKRDDGKGVDFDEIVRIMPGSYERKVEERVSVSYPGLPACYVLHTVNAFVDGLPEDEFVTEEGTEYGDCDHEVADEAVGVKKHFWKWVPANSV